MSEALSQLYKGFVDSTDALVLRFDVPVPSTEPFNTTCPLIHEDGQALLVVKLQNSWASFCRELVATSASNNSGSVRKAANFVSQYMGYDHPVWHSPEFVVRVAKHLALPNECRIDLHLSASLSSGQVTGVRNYIVHPGDRTESKFQEVAAAIGTPGVGVGKLLNFRYSGGTTLFERWVKDLQRTARNTTIV
ncbi:MAG: hypothetical protein F4X83_03180 [Chloroflexi bacterium]|nr:hypothetical protein [Chloroflexota bacterium]